MQALATCLRAAAPPRLLGCLALHRRLGPTERLANSVTSKGKVAPQLWAMPPVASHAALVSPSYRLLHARLPITAPCALGSVTLNVCTHHLPVE